MGILPMRPAAITAWKAVPLSGSYSGHIPNLITDGDPAIGFVAIPNGRVIAFEFQRNDNPWLVSGWRRDNLPQIEQRRPG